MSSTALTIYTGNGGVKDDSAVSYTGGASSSSKVGTRCPYVGLSNQGATCYMNSLLQTLFMTPEFRRALYQWKYNEERDGTREQCIALQLQRLFGLLQLSSNRAIDTVALTKSFGWEGSEVFQQQDVQELCRVLFDAIEDTFRGTDVDNVIDKLYAGELVDYLKCVGVDYQSDRRDKFLDYSLAITPFGSDVAMHSLHECVEHFLEPEILDGDNQYFVESVGRKADAIKGLKFGRLPQIMSVQLKRFVYDFSGDVIVNKKINEEVRFPFILDFNKYVSSGGEGDAFENFLAERIQRLRQKRRSSSADSADAPVEEAPEPSGTADTQNLPDLVDSEGNLCPELLADRLVAVVEESDEEKFMRRCYSDSEADAFSQEELQDLIRTNGPWIYELYAVMIHSGAITGGHYYAYVQDLSSKKWYDFDDSRVSEIERKKVKEAWGGNISVPMTYHSNYYGTTSTGQNTKIQSTANAYMLMYRKVKAGSDDEVAMPPAEDVPEYVRAELQKLEEEEEARRKLDEERFNKLVVKVVWDGVERTITTNRKKTYIEFLTQLWGELDVIDSPQLADWKEAHPPGEAAEAETEESSANVEPSAKEKRSFRPSYIPFDRIRLRQYNTYLKVPQDIHDVEAKGEHTLQMLQILDYRSVTLQCRAADEEWDEYILNGVNLVAMIYDPTADAFLPAKNIRMSRNASILELKEKLKHFVVYGVGDMRLLKLTALGVSDIRKEELVDDTAELERTCRIYEGTKVYLENNKQFTFEESPSVRCFIKSINTISVNLSSVGKNYFDIRLVVDRRMTFAEFRKKIAEEVNMEPTSFRIHRHIAKGQELQYAGHETLQMVGVYDGVSLALSEGTPLKPGFSSIGIVLYDNRCPGGIHCMTKLTLEEAREKFALERDPSTLEGEVAASNDTSVNGVADGSNDVEYKDSIVKAESVWSPDKSSKGGNDVVAVADAVPLSLPELVVQKSSSGSKGLGGADLGDASAELDAAAAGEEGDIAEAVVLSPSTSMTVLSRAVSGDGGTAGADSIDTPTPTESAEATGSLTAVTSTAETDDDEYMFGYRKVDLTVFAEQYTSLMKVVVEATYLVSDLRKDVLEKLIEVGTLPEGSPASLVRLREKWSNRAGGLLRDGLTLRQHNVSMVEGREIIAQVLNEPTPFDIPPTPLPVQGDCILFVQRWHRSTWTLGDRMEVYIQASWPVHVIVGCLAELTGIKDFRTMEVLIVQPHHHITVSSLADSYRSEGRKWANVSNEKSRLYDMQWYLTNGDLLLLQDPTEPLKELTEKEKLSVIRAREADFRANSSHSNPTGSNYLWPEESGSITVKPAHRPVGIHIRKHNNNDQKGVQGDGPGGADGDDTAAKGEELPPSGMGSPTGASDIEGNDHDKSRRADEISDMLLL